MINSILPIISISLNDDIINDIDKLQKNLGFTGRSEIVRAGLRNIIAEQKERDILQGKLAAILLIIHQERDDDQVTNMSVCFNTYFNIKKSVLKCKWK